jgi:hypothetical protein
MRRNLKDKLEPVVDRAFPPYSLDRPARVAARGRFNRLGDLFFVAAKNGNETGR